MSRKFTVLSVLTVMFILAACAPGFSLPVAIPGLTSPTPTECGCKVKGTLIATPTGGISASGPAGPAGPSAGDSTPVPADLSAVKDQWVTFTDAKKGFSFEYPAAYDAGQFKFCAAREANAETMPGSEAVVDLGSRTVISAYPLNGQTLTTALEAFKNSPSAQGAQYAPPQERTVGGAPALTQPYTSGGTNRYAEVTFFAQGDTLYRIDTGAPSACDISQINLRELDAYTRMLDSFKFK